MQCSLYTIFLNINSFEHTQKLLIFSFNFPAMVVASKDKKLANAAQQLLASSYLRISTSRYI